MTNGFFSKVLWIDLSEESFKEEEIPEEIYRQYLGGYGLAAKLIYESMPARTDPLDPNAILGFFPGLFTGTMAPLTGRYFVAGKSPLTGTWGDSSGGGYFGPAIKKCGYDGILIKGAAKNPVYVSIIDDQKQILDASELWGLDTIETEDKLSEECGNARIASIGPAGERLSLISGIMNDKGRAAARSGFGAVMGAKKLKAIVLKGNKKISLANKKELIILAKNYNIGIKNAKTGSSYLFKTQGLCGINVSAGMKEDAPVKNWGGSCIEDFSFDKLNKISGEKINKYRIRSTGCFSCPVQCGAVMKVPELMLEETHIPEYETCASFGHLLLNDDLFSMFALNDLCNRAGLDTISAGGTIAFAIECYENGLITKSDTDGLELTWGNVKSIFKLLKKMITREGIGDLFADGSKRASNRIGKESERYAIHSLGQELPMHDSKFSKSLARTYAFEPNPGRHTNASLDRFARGPMKDDNYVKEFHLPKNHEEPGNNRYEAMKMVSGLYQSTCALGMCYFTYWFQTYPLLECIRAIIGWDLSIDEIIKIGLRIQNLRQAFTLREGVDLMNNELPGRAVGNPPFKSGPYQGITIDYKTEQIGYCKKMGWNPENGYPLEETLRDLNLEHIVRDLYNDNSI